MKNNKKTLRLGQSDDEFPFDDQIAAGMPPQNRVFLQARYATKESK
jgi:hypothetical protein